MYVGELRCALSGNITILGYFNLDPCQETWIGKDQWSVIFGDHGGHRGWRLGAFSKLDSQGLAIESGILVLLESSDSRKFSRFQLIFGRVLATFISQVSQKKKQGPWQLDVQQHKTIDLPRVLRALPLGSLDQITRQWISWESMLSHSQRFLGHSLPLQLCTWLCGGLCGYFVAGLFNFLVFILFYLIFWFFYF